MRERLLGAVLALLVLAPAAAAADAPAPMLGTDLPAPLVLPGSGGGVFPRFAARAEPATTPTPRADCNAQSSPEPDIQGRVPKGSDAGFHCNFQALGHEGKSGGFKVERFVDSAGRECAYYDTSLLAFSNALTLGGTPTGTAVVDMSNPAHPVRTDTLLTPAMQSPHESLLVNRKRGLLAAVMGTPAFAPGFVDVYDLNADCRHPQLQTTLPVGILGHESGWSKDGYTFYATSIATGMITAVDMTDPQVPYALAVLPYPSHGTTISDDGNRAYVAALGGLIILDISEIQSRRPNPQAHVISKLTWDTITIPQNAQPFTVDGHPYLLETDEFSSTAEGLPTSHGPRVGAARIIDIADETAPRVVSNLRLAVHQPENRAALAGDPGALLPVQGYAAHYCMVPREKDPQIAACSMIVSGLRVFDIRDVTRPKELGYFVAPPGHLGGNALSDADAADFAMSRPTFVPKRGEIWYSDGNSGFYALKADPGVWPFPKRGAAAPQRCRRVLRLKLRKGATRAKVLVRGKRVKVRRRGGRLRVRSVVRGAPGARAKVRIVVRTKSGRRIKRVRRYVVCSG
jgi:hypothetical protein